MGISSLGAGAGVLTASVIDQLKAADTAAIITPIDTKITLQKQKGTALNLLNSLFTTFQTSVSSLNDSTLYQKRTVSGNSDAISVTAATGVSTQSLSISDTVMAKKNVLESGAFVSTDTKIASGTGTMSLSIGDTTYKIPYTASMSLDDIKTAINDTAGSKIKASTLQIGENDYRLVLTSQETGSSQNITVSDSVGGNLNYSLYKKQDTIASGLFTSPTALVSTASTPTQSTKFSLSQQLTDGGVSVEIGGTSYSADFDTDHATTLANFKRAIDASGLYTASISGNDVTITANTAGASYSITSSFSTTDSVAVASTTDVTPTSTGTYSITMNGQTYNIGYNNTTTLQNLADSINTTVGSNIASIKQAGSSYQLLLTSTATGEDSTFSVSNSGSLNSKLTTASINYTVASDIQKASDATFKYNGISITRSSNTVTDLVQGLTINLLQDSGSSNFAITQDVTSISDAMNSFVQNYNTLTSQLTSMTTSDTEAGTVGIFNGDSSITTIAREISRLVISTNSNGYSLAQFGIDLKEDGTMSFNSSTFTTKFNKDTALSEQFFSGLTTYDTNGNVESQIDGVFTQLNSLSERYMGTYGSGGGILNTLTTASDSALKTLTKDKTKAQELLDARYAAMSARFSQYDTMMAKLNNQFSSLSQQISMAVNGG